MFLPFGLSHTLCENEQQSQARVRVRPLALSTGGILLTSPNSLKEQKAEKCQKKIYLGSKFFLTLLCLVGYSLGHLELLHSFQIYIYEDVYNEEQFFRCDYGCDNIDILYKSFSDVLQKLENDRSKNDDEVSYEE